MKKLVKNRFTLVELLVSMAVFSILLVLMMQFFSGARTLWTANEKRAAIYADATVAMDLMSQLLQSTFYNSDGGTPFAITGIPAADNTSTPRESGTISDTNIDGWNSRIYFISNSPLELSKGGSVRYLSFQRKTDSSVTGVTRNVLELLVFSDSHQRCKAAEGRSIAGADAAVVAFGGGLYAQYPRGGDFVRCAYHFGRGYDRRSKNHQ